MKLLVITYPENVANEGLVLNQFFENGLECLHLRKPGSSMGEMEKLLVEIRPEYHSRISLHQHHELREKFLISRLHYTEEKRKQAEEKMLIEQKTKGIVLSTSVHSFEEYQKLPDIFDYCFYGPVFNSISKKNYGSVVSPDFKVGNNKKTELMAIGGIDEGNIDQTEKMGFSGVALLGAVWMNEKPLDKFLQIKKVCQQSQYMC